MAENEAGPSRAPPGTSGKGPMVQPQPLNKVERDRERLIAKRSRLEQSRKAAADKGKAKVGEKRGRDFAVKNAPTDPDTEQPVKKRYKARLPQSLKEIRKYQRTGSYLIRRIPFCRVVKEITQDVVDALPNRSRLSGASDHYR